VSSQKPHRSAWSYLAGEKGRNRVRVYERGAIGIYLDYRTEEGRRVRRPLGHADRNRAKDEADQVAARFGELATRPPAALSLRRLIEKYEAEVTPEKATTTQSHDRRVFKLLGDAWDLERSLASFDVRDWNRYIKLRRAGGLTDHCARDGAIENDLRLLLAVVHWGELVKDDAGNPLVARNPFAGFEMPTEVSPRRPSLTEAEFLALVTAAPRVHRRCPLFLQLAHETGHRSSAIAALRWSDVDFAGGSIRWREENDKMGVEHETPMSSHCAAVLKAAWRERASVVDAWIFTNARGNGPISRYRVRDWWRRLEVLSKIKRIPGRGWHSCRRKFATEHMDLPLVELMKLGGWKNERTIVQCYQQPRDERLRDALERRIVARRATGTN
jgi:integrase